MECGEETREADPIYGGNGLVLLPGSREGRQLVLWLTLSMGGHNQQTISSWYHLVW